MDAGRYHLTLLSGARPVMHGYWADLTTAERKYTSWIGGEHSNVDDARVTLVDEDEARVIHSWPDEA